MIPNNSLSSGATTTYKVPTSLEIEDIFRPPSKIKEYEMCHRYDYDFYVSGGMTGHDGHNFAMFHAITQYLRDEGLRVFNPAENFGGDKTLSRSVYMRKDQSALTRCSNILLLPSFRTSEGAIGELNNALSIPDMGIFLFVKAEGEGKPMIIKAKR